MRITVAGAGAWGTALARILHQGGHTITLWGHNPDHLEEIRRARENHRYLPGIGLPEDWRYEPDLARAAEPAEMLVMAVPSKALRQVSEQIGSYGGVAVSVTKGIEFASGLTMSGVLRQTMPRARVAALSGPTLAMEVAHGIPSAIVAASVDHEVALATQKAFHQPVFRVYSSSDIQGVELGGALKNIVAVAAGVGDGLGFGDNSKAALITRGIVEIRRLGVACGARPETFAGLSGLGDLTVTCFSRLSRNRNFGEQIGKGANIHDLLEQSASIVEGHPTAQAARKLAMEVGVETPIIEEVHAVLYQGKDPASAVQDLTLRESKPESDLESLPPNTG